MNKLVSAWIEKVIPDILKDKMSIKGLIVGIIVGISIGWISCQVIFAQHKISAAENMAAVAALKQQEAISENKTLRLDNERLQSGIDDLHGQIDVIMKAHSECNSKPDKGSEYIESLLATNKELAARLQVAKFELDRNGEQIKILSEDIECLRNCYSRIPDSCTNNMLLSVAYDFDNKIKLRDSSIEKETARLLKIKDQMHDLAVKAYIVQLKLDPESSYTRVFEKIRDFNGAVDAIYNIHLHFLSHVHRNAEKILVDNLLEPSDIFKIRLEADFKSVENARSLFDRMLQLDINNEAFFTNIVELLMSHIRSCGKDANKSTATIEVTQ